VLIGSSSIIPSAPCKPNFKLDLLLRSTPQPSLPNATPTSAASPSAGRGSVKARLLWGQKGGKGV